jgi:hypothetical protein
MDAAKFAAACSAWNRANPGYVAAWHPGLYPAEWTHLVVYQRAAALRNTLAVLTAATSLPGHIADGLNLLKSHIVPRLNAPRVPPDILTQALLTSVPSWVGPTVQVALTWGSHIVLDCLDQHHQVTRQLDIWVVDDKAVWVGSVHPMLGGHHPPVCSFPLCHPCCDLEGWLCATLTQRGIPAAPI